MQKALFLDRDGVINVDHGYVGRYEDFEYIDGIFPLVSQFQSHGYQPVIVTNQSGIARGFYSEGDFHELMAQVKDDFAQHGIKNLEVYYCPHHEEGCVPQYAIACACRKPKAGMFNEAAHDLNIKTADSVMIGDSWRDIVAADIAGVRKSFFINSKAITQAMRVSIHPEHKVTLVTTPGDITLC